MEAHLAETINSATVTVADTVRYILGTSTWVNNTKDVLDRATLLNVTNCHATEKLYLRRGTAGAAIAVSDSDFDVCLDPLANVQFTVPRGKIFGCVRRTGATTGNVRAVEEGL